MLRIGHGIGSIGLIDLINLNSQIACLIINAVAQNRAGRDGIAKAAERARIFVWGAQQFGKVRRASCHLHGPVVCHARGLLADQLVNFVLREINADDQQQDGDTGQKRICEKMRRFPDPEDF